MKVAGMLVKHLCRGDSEEYQRCSQKALYLGVVAGAFVAELSNDKE